MRASSFWLWRIFAASFFLLLLETPILRPQEYGIVRWSVGGIDPNPAGCALQVEGVRQILSDIGVDVSRQFSWLVVCDEKAWFHLKNSVPYSRTATTTGFTDFKEHVVYLNGFRKSASDLRDTIGHEIGHQICSCSDEDTANRVKTALLASAKIAHR